MKKTLCFVLLASLLLSLCACVPAGPEEPADVTFRGKTSEEYAQKGIDPSVKGTVTETEAFVDKGAKTVRMEGEDFDAISCSYAVISDDLFSGGKFLDLRSDREDETRLDHLDDLYEITYKVTVPATQPYKLTVVSGQVQWTANTVYEIYLNGELAFTENDAGDKGTVVKHNASVKLYPYEYGEVMLNEGENVFTFRLNNDSIRTSVYKTYTFFLDYIEVAPVDKVEFSGGMCYAEEPTDEYAMQKGYAAKVNVFSAKPDLAVNTDFTVWVPSRAGDYDFIIKDYNGNVVYTDRFHVGYGRYNYTAVLTGHPTGYFEAEMVSVVADGAEGVPEVIFHTAYVVVTDLSDRVVLDDSPFAVDLATADAWSGSPQLAMMYVCAAKLLGVTWIRERTRWRYLERYEGEYTYWSTDDFYRTLDTAGLNVATLLNEMPVWLDNTARGENYFVLEQRAFYNLCRMLGERYNGQVEAWEILNEQDWYGFEPQPESSYASFMKAGILGFADSGADTLKMMGALCQPTNDTNHLRVYEANDLLRFSDAFNYHNHVEYTHPGVTSYMEGTIAEEFTTYGAKTVPHLPTWVTEAGIMLAVHDGVLNAAQEKLQARYLVNSTVESLAHGTDKHFWFILRGGDPEGSITLTSYRPDRSPLPTVAAEAVMTETLGKGLYLGKLNKVGMMDEGYLFDTGADEVAVVWSSTKETVRLKTGGNVLCTDMMGNKSVLVADKDGYISLDLSTEEQYLTFADKAPADLYTPSDIDPAIPAVSKTDFTVGDHVVISQLWPATPIDVARGRGYAVSPSGAELHVYVANYNDVEVTGTITFDTEKFTVTGGETTLTLAPQETRELVFTVTPDGQTADTLFVISGTFNGEPCSPCAASVFIG